MLNGERSQTLDPVLAFVQAGDVMEDLAAVVEEGLATLHGHFFQRFQAVRHKPGADHVHPAYALGSQLFQGGLSVGLQPFGLAKARLEGQQCALGRDAKRCAR